MRPETEYQEALRWIAWGLNDSEVSRMMRIPRGTIRDWRQSLRVLDGHRTTASPVLSRPRGDCPRCYGTDLPEPEYCYLLGLYLGDGHIAEAKEKVYVLRIVQDASYPVLIEECARTMRSLRAPGVMRTSFVNLPGCVVVQAYWKHWPCLFPQHGPGKKHNRPILFERWQAELTDRHPEQLLRGLIHSDEWRGVNRVHGGRYEYPRFQFSNRSRDIRDIFCSACDRLGVTWRQMNRWTISIARREDVFLLDSFIEKKS